MKFSITRKAIVRGVLVAGLLTVLGSTFHAYQNPAHTVQWLALLQLCR